MMGGEPYPGMCSVDPANTRCIITVKPMLVEFNGCAAGFPSIFARAASVTVERRWLRCL
jgi:hypothetical protein